VTPAEDPPTDDDSAPPEDRIYSGDMVLLVLFIAIAAVFALLLFVNRQMDHASGEGVRSLLVLT
jgi:hypothetical protein